MPAQRITVHMLTAYPPSNPNRDELGQPKSAVVGGKTRQRISSQCMKRTWRLSAPMKQFEEQFSTRTRELGSRLAKAMTDAGMSEADALKRATMMAEKFGKIEKKRAPAHSEMVVIGHEEWQDAMDLAAQLASEGRDPTADELEGLPKPTLSIDCALFGRMRAASPELNVDAAVAVSHPLTVNASTVEADFWTSVDDLKAGDDSADSGSGGMGDVEFGSGVYYTYAEISLDALNKNLGGDVALARSAVAALIEAMATTVPNGHRSTFGHNVRAAYLRAEVGDGSGNLFCAAFETPVNGLPAAVKALRDAADREQGAYGLAAKSFEMCVPEGKGRLAEVIDGVRTAICEA